MLLNEQSRHIRATLSAILKWNLAEEEHFLDVRELSRFDFVGCADAIEGLDWKKGGRWDTSGLFGGIAPRVGVDVDVGFKEFGAEDVVVSRVPEDVERLIWVLNSKLPDCWVVEASLVDCVVKVDAVPCPLVRWDNQELGNSQARWEFCWMNWLGCRERVLLGCWLF